MTSVFSLVFLDRGIPHISATAQRPLQPVFTVIRYSIYPVPFAIIVIKQNRTYDLWEWRGAAKILWGSSAEQTREEMLANRVE